MFLNYTENTYEEYMVFELENLKIKRQNHSSINDENIV